jgi:hypothetical protein
MGMRGKERNMWREKERWESEREVKERGERER